MRLPWGETDPRAGGSGVLDADVTYSVSSVAGEAGFALPYTIEQIDVKVIGNRLSTPWGLTQFAIKLAQIRLPLFPPGNSIAKAAIRQSLTDRWAELQIAVKVILPQVNKV